MYQIHAARFVQFFQYLADIRRELSDPDLLAHDSLKLASTLDHAAEDYKKLADFGVVADFAERLAKRIRKGEPGPELKIRLEAWVELLEAELDRRLWFGMSAEETDLYLAKDLLVGADYVYTRGELEEASKCLALGQPAASSFHSIRALEVLLNTLAEHIGVQRGQNWHAAIQKIEKEHRRKRESKSADDRAWAKEWDRFYADLGAHFFHLKTSRRNPSMHWSVEETSNKTAKSVLNHTIELMEAMSRCLSEYDSVALAESSEQAPSDA